MWGVYIEGQEKHVIPEDDLRDHDRHTGCWCRPRADDGVIVHNSMDRRELYEAGILRPA